eukprot:maker-scaffold7597_size3096-snap-gene-0.1 protein:Tk03292 transcript:maker-scaffold7597_size3096-snap-gene-0.1-mRNA-1 annotation:"tumor necrosis factor receptor superfamily member 11b"
MQRRSGTRGSTWARHGMLHVAREERRFTKAWFLGMAHRYGFQPTSKSTEDASETAGSRISPPTAHPGATWADSQSPEVNTPASASWGEAGPMGRDSSGWKVQKGRGPAKSRKEMPNRSVGRSGSVSPTLARRSGRIPGPV